MIHDIVTEKNYIKACKIYLTENDYDADFDEIIKDHEVFDCPSDEWKTLEKHDLIIQLDDSESIEKQLNELRIGKVGKLELIETLLKDRASLLQTIEELEESLCSTNGVENRRL